jgi:hypothetical protein
MLQRRPAVVLRPTCDADVVIGLRVAAEHGLSVALRGAGHSQSGQGLGQGLLLDMTGLNRVLQVPSTSACSLEVEAGATWRSVLDATHARGLVPVALTHALDTTVAGTLSVGGVGGESFRAGAQVDHVEYFDVATLDEGAVRCSPTERPELFDAVRAGLGQCAVMLRVGYPLRVCGSRLGTRCFAYVDARHFLLDSTHLAHTASSNRWLAGAIRADPNRPNRQLLFLLVGEESDDDSSPSIEDDLHYEFELSRRASPFWTNDATPSHPFFRVFGKSEVGLVHPWVEHFFAQPDAGLALAEFLTECPSVIGRGSANILWLKRPQAPAPLLRTPPQGGLLLGIGAFASFPRADRSEAARTMLGHAARMSARGGQRYLSGFFPKTTAADWARHYADAWRAFGQSKHRYDPNQTLSPGFIDWG